MWGKWNFWSFFFGVYNENDNENDIKNGDIDVGIGCVILFEINIVKLIDLSERGWLDNEFKYEELVYNGEIFD